MSFLTPLRHREPAYTLEDQIANFCYARKADGSIANYDDNRASRTRTDFSLYTRQYIAGPRSPEVSFHIITTLEGHVYCIANGTLDVEVKQKLTQYDVTKWSLLQNLNLTPDDIWIPENESFIEDTLSVNKMWGWGNWNSTLIIQNWVPEDGRVYSVVMGTCDLVLQHRLNQQANRQVGDELKGKVILDLRIGTRIYGEDISKSEILLPILLQKATDIGATKTLLTKEQNGTPRTPEQIQHDLATKGIV